MSSEIKHMSISDDFLALEQARRAHEESAEVTTHKSFMEKRHRHSSVPQTARPQVKKSSFSNFFPYDVALNHQTRLCLQCGTPLYPFLVLYFLVIVLVLVVVIP